MKATYIKPFISFDEMENDIEILAGSPHVQVGGAAGDTGADLTDNPGGTGGSGSGSVGDGDGEDGLAKGGTFIWDDEF